MWGSQLKKKESLLTLFLIVLAWQDGFRTYDWGRAVGDLETTMKEIRHLMALV